MPTTSLRGVPHNTDRPCDTCSDKCEAAIDKISIDTIIKLLPSFIHLPPDEAAKAAINYAKALIKELER